MQPLKRLNSAKRHRSFVPKLNQSRAGQTAAKGEALAHCPRTPKGSLCTLHVRIQREGRVPKRQYVTSRNENWLIVFGATVAKKTRFLPFLLEVATTNAARQKRHLGFNGETKKQI